MHMYPPNTKTTRNCSTQIKVIKTPLRRSSNFIQSHSLADDPWVKLEYKRHTQQTGLATKRPGRTLHYLLWSAPGRGGRGGGDKEHKGNHPSRAHLNHVAIRTHPKTRNLACLPFHKNMTRLSLFVRGVFSFMVLGHKTTTPAPPNTTNTIFTKKHVPKRVAVCSSCDPSLSRRHQRALS